MKKFILLFLLIPSLCFAVEPIDFSKSIAMSPAILGGSAGVAAAGCVTADNGDELDEGFVGTGGANNGYENAGWTETIGAGGTVDQDSTLTGTPPSGSCSSGTRTEGLRVIASEANTWVYWDKGSTIDTGTQDVDITMHVMFHDFTIPNFGYIYWGYFGNNATPTTSTIGNLRIFNNNNNTFEIDANTGTTSTTNVVIQKDTWYTITLHIDASDAATSYLQVVGGGSETCDVAGECTFTAITASDARYFHFGGPSAYGAGEVLDIYYAYIYINTP